MLVSMQGYIRWRMPQGKQIDSTLLEKYAFNLPSHRNLLLEENPDINVFITSDTRKLVLFV